MSMLLGGLLDSKERDMARDLAWRLTDLAEEYVPRKKRGGARAGMTKREAKVIDDMAVRLNDMVFGIPEKKKESKPRKKKPATPRATPLGNLKKYLASLERTGRRPDLQESIRVKIADLGGRKKRAGNVLAGRKSSKKKMVKLLAGFPIYG